MTADYHARIVAPLLADSVLGACRHDDLARLLPHISELELAPGESLWRSGDVADAVYLLREGELAVGDARAISGLCGDACLFGLTQREQAAHALTAVRVLRLPLAAMLRLADAPLRERVQQRWQQQLQQQLQQRVHAPDGSKALDVSERATGESVPPSITPTIAVSPALTWGKPAFGWLCALLFPLALLTFGHTLGLGVDAVIFLAILSATVCMWVFALVDDYVPGIFALTATLALGIATPAQVLAGFASDGFFLALSVLGLGAVISASGLSFRFLLALLHRLPDKPRWRETALLITGFLLTPLVPSINGRVALVAPLLKDIADVLRTGKGSATVNRLAVASFTGVTLLSAVFLTSKSVNFVVYGLLDAQTQAEFQWLTWVWAALAFGLVQLVAYVVFVTLWRRAQPARIEHAEQSFAEQIFAQLSLLGPLKNREWAALVGVAVFVLGIASASLHRIHPSWIALGILFSLLVFGVLRKDEFREKIDWPFLMYLGGLVGLTGTMSAVGLDVWLGEHLAWLGGFMRESFAVFLLLLTLVLGVIRLVVPISATIVIAATVFMPLAATHGVSPWVVGFAVLVIGEMWFMPYQCSYYLQFRELGKSVGYDERTMLRFNAALNAVRLLALYLSLPWWHALGLL
jgi:divalent anion:Na+ symporter, DASS family